MPALVPQTEHSLPTTRTTGALSAPPSRALGRRSGLSRSATVALCLILGAFFFYATAIRDGHDWGGDYAQYILHAKALTQGLDYAPPPGFILNPYLPWVPVAYPPFYPLCIAGVLALLGLNFIALKIQIVAFFSVALYAYWRLLRSSMPVKVALAALAFLAFSPYHLKYSNKLLSEIPYLAVSLFAILAAERFFRPKSSFRDAAGFTLLLVLACCARSAGLALIAAAPAYALLFRRTHLLRAALVSGIAFGILCAISWDMIGIYLNQTKSDPLRVLAWLEGKPRGYFQQMMRYFALHPRTGSTLGMLVNAPVTAAFLGLSALGAGHLLWKNAASHTGTPMRPST